MGHSASKTMTSDPVPVGRLLRVGALAAVFSAIANALMFAIATFFFGAIVIPPVGTVTLCQVVGASVAGGVGAAAIFAFTGRFTRRPIRVFWGVAVVGLVLSFAPIALVGATGSSAVTLALMHVVAAVTNVGLLTTLGQKA
jgi:hypothetical protein